MKIGKLEIANNTWYWDNEQLAPPLKILWSCLFFVPFYLSLAVACLMTAGFHRNWYYAEELWSENA